MTTTLGLLLGSLGLVRGAAPITEGRSFNGLPPGESDVVELGALPPRHLDLVVVLQSNASGTLQLFLGSVEAPPVLSAHFADSFRASLNLTQRGHYIFVLTDLAGNESLFATVVITLSGPEWDLVLASGPLLVVSLAVALVLKRPRLMRVTEQGA